MATLLLGGCYFSPQPVLEYRASTTQSIWDNGIELHSSQTNQFAFKVGFLELGETVYEGSKASAPLIFRISCTNRTNDTVLFDPGNFRLSSPEKDSVLNNINPAAVIFQAKKDMAVENAQFSSSQGTAAILGVVDLGVDILSLFANETQPDKDARYKSSEEMRQSNREEEASHHQRMANLDHRIQFWSLGMLGKSSLSPGERIDGRIAFGLKSIFEAPDSLFLQYREKDGHFVNLVDFRLNSESMNDLKKHRKNAEKSDDAVLTPIIRF
jgi:hypothetical protein